VTIFAAYLIILLGGAIVGLCGWFLIRPWDLLDLVKSVLERSWWMFAAVGTRLILGVALLLIADGSAFPLVFTIIGWLGILAAIVIPFMGVSNITAMIERMESLPLLALRAWLFFGVLFGGVLIYGTLPLL
jgi:hypothetical protein